jgi:perosamine synthetase
LAWPDIGDAEVEAVERVLRSGTLTGGPETVRFERAFADRHEAAHGVAFANGTVALQGIHLGLGIGPGDEVVVPSMTFISTATSVLHVGAQPVFCDVRPDTFDLDPEDVERKLTGRTRAIVAVHYGGQAADVDALRSLADDAGVALIEDAAEAHGAGYRGRPVGALGTAGMFSFTPTKNMTTGEGGMVVTDDAALAEQLRLLRNHGQTAQYEHAVLGYNWRLSEMQAAIGVVQLDKLDAILERKRALACALTEGLEAVEGITPPSTAPERDHVFMLYTTLVESCRDDLLIHLLGQGIEARVYFPPAHRQPIFESRAPADLPVTDWLADRMLSLPIHSRLTAGEVDEIVGEVEEGLEAVRK